MRNKRCRYIGAMLTDIHAQVSALHKGHILLCVLLLAALGCLFISSEEEALGVLKYVFLGLALFGAVFGAVCSLVIEKRLRTVTRLRKMEQGAPDIIHK